VSLDDTERQRRASELLAEVERLYDQRSPSSRSGDLEEWLAVRERLAAMEAELADLLDLNGLTPTASPYDPALVAALARMLERAAGRDEG
jgi:hypothetical protein